MPHGEAKYPWHASHAKRKIIRVQELSLAIIAGNVRVRGEASKTATTKAHAGDPQAEAPAYYADAG